eukprot:Opistho-2@47265
MAGDGDGGADVRMPVDALLRPPAPPTTSTGRKDALDMLKTPAGLFLDGNDCAGGAASTRYLVARPVLHELRNDDVFGKALLGRRWGAFYRVFRTPAFNIFGYIVWSVAVVWFGLFACYDSHYGVDGRIVTGLLTLLSTMYVVVWDLCITRTITKRLMRTFEFWFIAVQMLGFSFAMSWLWKWDYRITICLASMQLGLLHYLVADAMALGLRARVLERLLFAIIPLIVSYVALGMRVGSQYVEPTRLTVGDGYVDVRIVALDFCLNIIIFLSKYAATLFKDRRSVILIHGRFKLQRTPMGDEANVIKTEVIDKVEGSTSLASGVMSSLMRRAVNEYRPPKKVLSTVPSFSPEYALDDGNNAGSINVVSAVSEDSAVDGNLSHAGATNAMSATNVRPRSTRNAVAPLASSSGFMRDGVAEDSVESRGRLSQESGSSGDGQDKYLSDERAFFPPLTAIIAEAEVDPPTTTATVRFSGVVSTLPGIVAEDSPMAMAETSMVVDEQEGGGDHNTHSATATNAVGKEGTALALYEKISNRSLEHPRVETAPAPSTVARRRRYYLQSLAVEHKIDVTRTIGHALVGGQVTRRVWSIMRHKVISVLLSVAWFAGCILSCMAVSDMSVARHPAALVIAVLGICLHIVTITKSNLDIMRLIVRTFEFYFMMFENVGQVAAFVFYFQKDERIIYALFAATGTIMCTCFDAQSAKMRQSTKYAMLISMFAFVYTFIVIYLRLFDKQDISISISKNGVSFDVRLLLCNRIAVLAIFYAKYFYIAARDSSALLLIVAPCILTREITAEAAIHKSSHHQRRRASSAAAPSKHVPPTDGHGNVDLEAIAAGGGAAADGVTAGVTVAWGGDDDATDGHMSPRHVSVGVAPEVDDGACGDRFESAPSDIRSPKISREMSRASILFRRLSSVLSLPNNMDFGAGNGESAAGGRKASECERDAHVTRVTDDVYPESAGSDVADEVDWEAYEDAMAEARDVLEGRDEDDTTNVRQKKL